MLWIPPLEHSLQSALLLLIVKHVQIAVVSCRLFISAETCTRLAPRYRLELVAGIKAIFTRAKKKNKLQLQFQWMPFISILSLGWTLRCNYLTNQLDKSSFADAESDRLGMDCDLICFSSLPFSFVRTLLFLGWCQTGKQI